jgi:hypothetical protein
VVRLNYSAYTQSGLVRLPNIIIPRRVRSTIIHGDGGGMHILYLAFADARSAQLKSCAPRSVGCNIDQHNFRGTIPAWVFRGRLTVGRRVASQSIQCGDFVPHDMRGLA